MANVIYIKGKTSTVLPDPAHFSLPAKTQSRVTAFSVPANQSEHSVLSSGDTANGSHLNQMSDCAGNYCTYSTGDTGPCTYFRRTRVGGRKKGTFFLI